MELSRFPDLTPLPSKPSRAEIEQARTLIEEPLVDFPFTGPAEKAHIIALMIQPFVRPMISGPTPMYLVESPTPGIGKGKLVGAACYPALGRILPVMSESLDGEEIRKQITSFLAESPPFIFLDNMLH